MSDQITFTLDGTEVTASADETIWEVAKRLGTDIPHLCHSDEPGYRSDGNCRACMVEIDGERVLAASCIRTPTEGMAVKSASERAQKSRKMVMELLLADLPVEAHDTSSHLLDMAQTQDISISRFPKSQTVPLLDSSHVAMRINLDACIHCNLCVRACRAAMQFPGNRAGIAVAEILRSTGRRGRRQQRRARRGTFDGRRRNLVDHHHLAEGHVLPGGRRRRLARVRRPDRPRPRSLSRARLGLGLGFSFPRD